MSAKMLANTLNGIIATLLFVIKISFNSQPQNGYHKFTPGFLPMSNILTEKEVNYESI
jgi:hypothetical protein